MSSFLVNYGLSQAKLPSYYSIMGLVDPQISNSRATLHTKQMRGLGWPRFLNDDAAIGRLIKPLLLLFEMVLVLSLLLDLSPLASKPDRSDTPFHTLQVCIFSFLLI